MVIKDIVTYIKKLGHRNILFVKVITDNDLYGWGESGLSSRECAVAGAISHFKHFLIGKDPLNTGALWQEMYRSQYFEGGRVLSAAIAAIDIALHDIKGKHFQMPVYQLLGGQQRKKIPLFATVTAPLDENLADHCLALIEAGWNHIRLTTGEHGSPLHSTLYDPKKSLSNAGLSHHSSQEGHWSAYTTGH